MGIIGAIVLAAGKSSRMGRPKSLLSWDGDILINYQIRTLFQSGVSEIIIVLGYQAKLISSQVLTSIPYTTVVNPEYSKGKTTSIRAGIKLVSNNVSELVLIGVDQPRSQFVLNHLIQKHVETGALITQPVYGDKGGHPLIFNSKLFPELSALNEQQMGVREVINNYLGQINQVVTEDKSVMLDLNTPSQFEQAKSMFKLDPPQFTNPEFNNI